MSDFRCEGSCGQFLGVPSVHLSETVCPSGETCMSWWNTFATLLKWESRIVQPIHMPSNHNTNKSQVTWVYIQRSAGPDCQESMDQIGIVILI